MPRIVTSTAVAAMIIAGVIAAVLSFVAFQTYVGDPTADLSTSVTIVFDESQISEPEPPPQTMTGLGELTVWLGLLSVNIGIAAGIVVGVLMGARTWWTHRDTLPPGPGAKRSWLAVGFSCVLILAIFIPTRQMEAIGDIASDPPVHPDELVPRVFEASRFTTWTVTVVGLLGLVALLWLREVAAAPWDAVPDRRLAWLECVRHAASSLLAALSLTIVAAVFSTGALLNLVVATFGDGVDIIDGIAILFGALLSIVLALAYLPTHAAIERQAASLTDDVAPVSLEDYSEAAISKRKSVTGLVQNTTSGRSSLEANLLIAGPLLSSLITVLLR